MTRKWNIVSNNSKSDFDVQNEIIYNTEVLKSNLCDNKVASILVRGITITAHQATKLVFDNYVPFTHGITFRWG